MTGPPAKGGLAVGLEVGPKRRVFAQVLGWPGWVRAARDEDRAVEAVAAYAPRYAAVAARAGLEAPTALASVDLRVIERVEGDTTTDFGALDRLLPSDRDSLDAGEVERSIALLDAIWAFLDEVYRAVPAGVRSTKPASGRPPAGVRLHVAETDALHLSGFGGRYRKPVEADLEAVEVALRSAILSAVREIEPGGQLEPRRRSGVEWTPRFAIRRTAWHALDHAWELQDRAGHE